MRKLSLLFLTGVLLLGAKPYNPFSALVVDKGSGFVGPSVPVSIQLANPNQLAFGPALRAGYGLVGRFDASVMVQSVITPDDFYPVDGASLKGRYQLVNEENFALAPTCEVSYIYSDDEHYGALVPGIMGNIGISSFLVISAELEGAYVFGEGFGIWAFLTPQLLFGKYFSMFLDVQLRNEASPYYRPGLQVFPAEWLSLNAGVVIPPIDTAITYLTPGLAAYVSF